MCLHLRRLGIGSLQANQAYRQLQILNSEFNNSFSGGIVVLFVFGVFSVIILCAIIQIKFHASIHLFYNFIFISIPAVYILGVVVTSPMGSNVYDASASYVRYCKENALSPYNTAFIASCRPLRVKIGPFFRFIKSTTISALGIFAYLTLRVVVTLKTGNSK